MTGVCDPNVFLSITIATRYDVSNFQKQSGGEGRREDPFYMSARI